jgi:hypothetical protein
MQGWNYALVTAELRTIPQGTYGEECSVGEIPEMIMMCVVL